MLKIFPDASEFECYSVRSRIAQWVLGLCFFGALRLASFFSVVGFKSNLGDLFYVKIAVEFHVELRLLLV